MEIENDNKYNGKWVMSNVNGSVDLAGSITPTDTNVFENTTTDTFMWKGGWVCDNFGLYYLDEKMVKHYR